MHARAFLTAILVVAVPVIASADWDESVPARWIQLPDCDTTGIDVNATYAHILADDFVAVTSDVVMGIHLWGSWLDDRLPFGTDPEAVTFIICFHEDIPDSLSATGYSMPGDTLWMRTVEPDDFFARIWESGLAEGWLNPGADYVFPADTTCWQYNIWPQGPDEFQMQGSPSEPVVYWLTVQALSHDPTASFGWKTSLDHWHDGAVWAWDTQPHTGPWAGLAYPAEHPLHPGLIDLAFVVEGMSQEQYDWGDAPDPPYPTLALSGGAVHMVSPDAMLGGFVDAEPNGQPHPHALGDDNTGEADEDGITFLSPLAPGLPASVGVQHHALPVGYLDAWIDFNGDGSWAEPGDCIIDDLMLSWDVDQIGFVVPATATPGIHTFARFRISTAGGCGYAGDCPDGEVEDYEVYIEEEPLGKWAQLPDPFVIGPDATSLDANSSSPYVLADDFVCEMPGRLTTIYVWGTWINGPPAGDETAVDFTLCIYDDRPDSSGRDGTGTPGNPVWCRTLDSGEFAAEEWGGISEALWLEPPDTMAMSGTVRNVWLYQFETSPEEAFLQIGTPVTPVRYWLGVQAAPHDLASPFGWSSSASHTNDYSVWSEGSQPHPGPWTELRLPWEHPWYPGSIDFAFAVVTSYGADVPDEVLPAGSLLQQNAPNPFNPSTTLRYVLPEPGRATLRVFDAGGRLVRTLVDEWLPEGPHEVEWDGRNDAEQPMPSGVYFCTVSASGREQQRKMVLLR